MSYVLHFITYYAFLPFPSQMDYKATFVHFTLPHIHMWRSSVLPLLEQ